MEMVIETTVINIEDIVAIEGEKVTFEMPTHSILPVGVLDMDGNLLGYLGRNDATCVPGSVTGQDFCQMLKEGWVLNEAEVVETTYYRTKHRKLILSVVLTNVEELTYV